MKSFKLSAVAALLASFTFAASAMTPVSDDALAQVSGQDGVSIVADLHVNIGSFTYTDKDSADSLNTFAMNDIGIKGVLAATIDVISGTSFQTAAVKALADTGLDNVTPIPAAGGATQAQVAAGKAAAELGFTGQDVIQIGIADVSGTNGLDVKVGSMTTGNAAHTGRGASMGGISLAKLDLAGTKVWMFGHN